MMRSFSKKRKPGTRRVKRRPKTSGEKNGRLILALSGALLVMITLGYIVSGLVGDENEDQKSSAAVPSELEKKLSKDDTKDEPKDEPKSSRPKIMFYEELENQEETKTSNAHTEPQPKEKVEAKIEQATDTPHEKKLATPIATDSRQKPRPPMERRASRRPEPRPTKEIEARQNRSKDPQPFYTVQVGAFSNPSLAQQWAKQWEDRGFRVMIKPVARPRTGVLYRLFLGEFHSKEDADLLVKRLKDNEGITALRLLVRN